MLCNLYGNYPNVQAFYFIPSLLPCLLCFFSHSMFFLIASKYASVFPRVKDERAHISMMDAACLTEQRKIKTIISFCLKAESCQP